MTETEQQDLKNKIALFLYRRMSSSFTVEGIAAELAEVVAQEMADA